MADRTDPMNEKLPFLLTGSESDPMSRRQALQRWSLPNASECIEAFAKNAPDSPWQVPYHAYFAGSGASDAPHLCFAFLTHGNEWGSMPAALLLLDELKSGRVHSSARVSVLLGNIEAAQRDVRFVEDDYNRVFSFEKPADSVERHRAEQVRPVLDDVDFALDIHQTQTPTESAFWTFPWSNELANWARVLRGAPLGLTRAPGGAFAPGRLCLDEYVRSRGKVGITVEIGTKGPELSQAERAYLAVRHGLETHEALLRGETLEDLALAAPAIQWFETIDVLQTVPGARLKPGLGCWTAVRQGELLSAPGAPEMSARADGRVLFPKYDEPLPPEIARLAVPLADPQAHYGC